MLSFTRATGLLRLARSAWKILILPSVRATTWTKVNAPRLALGIPLLLALYILVSLSAIGALPSERSRGVDRDTPPDVLIRTTTEEVIALIKANPIAQSETRERDRLIALVQEKVGPHFDFVAMTRLAVGVHWRSGTPEQQERLIEEFRALLLRTYAQVLLSYQDDTIVFKPLHMASGSTDATVRVLLRGSGREAIPIDFAMEKTPAGWKVYDVAVGGVSLVTNYRDSFASTIREFGIDGLIRELKKKTQA